MSLTRADASGATLIDGRSTSAERPSAASREHPHRIGRYTVVEVLGEGGMGTVFSAYDPHLDRKVALKVLHGGDAAHSEHTNPRARLLREAQAIAKVTHPNVIHVYDVGTVELHGDTQVFVAMEQVIGQSLRTWMDALSQTDRWRRGEAVREIVEVVAQAGRGLAAAHAAGLVHRDFKPDNALLGDDGLVRVVDFGLARPFGAVPEDSREDLSGSREDPPSRSVLQERLTVTGTVVGTPAYMAPEQFRGAATDGRTDQFALCLTLYEALYGVRPFAEQGYRRAVAVMKGDMRPRPLVPPVPDRLHAVIERGLRTAPDERFDSMEALVEALRHSVAGQWRAGWVAGTLVAGISLVALVATRVDPPADPCGGGVLRMAEVWNAERRDALRQSLQIEGLPYASRVTEGTIDALERYAQGWVDGHRDACEATHVRHEQTGALLDKRMICLDQRMAAMDASIDELSAKERARVEHALAVVDGLPALSTCADGAALAVRVAPPPDDATRREVAAIRAELERAAAKQRLRAFDQALAIVTALGPRAEAVDYAPLEPEMLLRHGRALALARQAETAEGTLHRALLRAQALGMDELVLEAAMELARVVGVQRAQPKAGIGWADLAEATAQRVGIDPAQRAELLRNRAWVLVEWGLDREAIDIAQQALAAASEAHGSDDYEMIGVHSSLGSVYGRLQELDDARQHFERALELGQHHLGPDHPQLLNTYRNLGNVYSALHQLDQARTYLEKAAEVTERLPDASREDRAFIINALGSLAYNERRWDAARDRFEEALRLREALLGPEHPMVARTVNSLANTVLQLGDLARAEALYLRSLRIREAAHGPDHPGLVIALDNLAMMLVRNGRAREALAYLERGDTLLAANPDAPGQVASHRYWLGRALVESGEDRARGEALVDDALGRFVALGDEGMRREIEAWIQGRRDGAAG